jgi:leader peptidase (prepilin peptidase)/N-methyltransferase
VRQTPLRGAAVLVAVGLAGACVVVLDGAGDILVGIAGCAVLVAVTVVDVESRRVPNRIILPALAVALVARSALDPSPRWLLGAVAAGGILLALALVYPAGLGMGDVKLAAFLGAWLGWYGLIALVLGMFAGFVPALWILATKGRAGAKIGLPYAPFLALGGVLALLAGHDIYDWYRGAGS